MLKAYRRRYSEWAERRPTMGPYLLIISAILIARPPLNGFQVGDLVLTLSSISGVSTVVLAIIMGVCALAALASTKLRLLSGLAAMITALVAFPAANFGGYIFGTVFGIVGASLILAWQPDDRKAVAAEEQTAQAQAAGTGEGADATADGRTVADGPTTQIPAVDEPTTEIPAVDEPSTDVPSTEAPSTEPLPTEGPDAEPPTDPRR